MNAAGSIERIRQYADGDEPDRAEARRLAEAALRADPENADVLDIELELLAGFGEHDLAERLVSEFLLYIPHSLPVAERHAWLMWQRGLEEEAIAEMRALAMRRPECVRGRLWLLAWQSSREQWSAAEGVAKELLRMALKEEQELDARIGLAFAIAKQGRKEEARNAFAETSARFPESERAACHHAEILLDQNMAPQAADVIVPIASKPGAGPLALVRAMDACVRAKRRDEAIGFFDRYAATFDGNEPSAAVAMLEWLKQLLGLEKADEHMLALMRRGAATDSIAVEFLERTGQRGHRGRLIEIFRLCGAQPRAWKRTMCRFLGTFHYAPLMPGTISRWVRAHAADIAAETLLWAGVGAWMIDRRRWREAEAHLATYPQRRDAEPWMILLYGTALDALGRRDDACTHYRNALDLPSDHSEAAIRTRLAMNLAAAGLAANGKLVLMDMSRRAKELQAVGDVIRTLAVSSLADIGELRDLEAARHEMNKTLGAMAQFGRAAGGDGVESIAMYRVLAKDQLARFSVR